MHKKPLILVLIVIALFAFPMTHIMWKEDHTCDTKVTMKDSTEYQAVRVYHSNDGMTWLKGCSGNEKRFPTVDIKTIEKINQ